MTAHTLSHPVTGPGVTCTCGFGFDTYRGLDAHIATAIKAELRASLEAALAA
jgi:hypothetical protein